MKVEEELGTQLCLLAVVYWSWLALACKSQVLIFQKFNKIME